METSYQIHIGKTGKQSDKWESYFPVYDRCLASYRNAPITLLEIGVQNGGSLETWAKYFPQATKIVGVDINPLCGQLVFDDPRIHVISGDATATEIAQRIFGVCKNFDIVIDDGSHTNRDVVRAFAQYFPTINENGLFIAEDLCTSYFGSYGGGLWHPNSSMQFFKSLADCISHEHWGNGKTREELMQRFSKAYDIALPESLLSCVHSIEFTNSVCVVRKMSPEKNRLGRRYVSGTEAKVQNLTGVAGLPNDETNNIWSQRDPFDKA